MLFLRVLLASLFIAQAPIAAHAQTANTPAPVPGTVTLPAVTPAPSVPAQIQNPAIGQTPIGMAHVTVKGGTLAGDALEWLALVFGTTLSGVIVAWVLKGLQKMGVDVKDADRKRLQEIIANGVSLGAHDLAAKLDGTMEFEVKNKVLAAAVTYAQAHGAETMKKLGLDPNDPNMIEVLRARAAKAIDDKISPTAVLGPDVVKA